MQGLSTGESRLPVQSPLWSVVALEGERKGRAIAHLPRVTLRDCSFRVGESGRRRVIQNKVRHVHAWVVGRIAVDGEPDGVEFSCNPYRCAWLYLRSDPLFRLAHAPVRWFVGRQAFAAVPHRGGAADRP